MIKWLFSDIDGTLLPYDQPFSQRTIRTIRNCPVPLTLVSGRMPIAMLPITHQLGLSGIQCANNGAVIFNIDGGQFQVLKTFPLQQIVFDQVSGLLQRDFPDINYCWYGLNEWFASGWDDQVRREADYSGVQPTIAQRPQQGKPILAMLVIEPVARVRQRFLTAVEQLHLPDLRVFYTGGGFIEMTSRQAGKDSVVNFVRQQFGYRRDELAAFGDGGNDLALLQAVGHPVAVANAAPEIKQVAATVAARDTADGVAQTIKNWVASHQLGES